MAALTYFDLYADAFRRGVMTEGQLVSAVRLGRITLPQAFEIRDTGGKCGALWTPPPTPTPTPETPTTPEGPATTPTPESGAQGSTAPDAATESSTESTGGTE